jgi:hypothetical protein
MLINPYTGSFIIFFLFKVAVKYAKVLNYDKTSTLYLLIYVKPLYIFVTKHTA